MAKMNIQKEIKRISRVKQKLAYRPMRIVREKYFYYTAWSFKKDKKNQTLLLFLNDMHERGYLADDYTGFCLDVIDEGGSLHETFSWTTEGWEWFKETMKIGRAYDNDKRLIKEAEKYEHNEENCKLCKGNYDSKDLNNANQSKGVENE